MGHLQGARTQLGLSENNWEGSWVKWEGSVQGLQSAGRGLGTTRSNKEGSLVNWEQSMGA